ncbi:MAG: hypothetical protein HY535_05515 [Chloroflexi bacterium]|nr:hypothetical protein [Chloroflexota bacterium]
MGQEPEERHDALETFVVSVAEQLKARTPKERVVDALVADGLDRSQALSLVEQVHGLLLKARSRAAVRHLRRGLLLLLGGGAVTLLTWSLAGPGGTYVLAWGALVAGALYLGYGLYLQLTSQARSKRVLAWAVASLVACAALATASVLAYRQTVGRPSPELPPDSAVQWTRDVSRGPDQRSATFSGEVRNLDDRWSITEVYVEVAVVDVRGQQLAILDRIAVTPPRLGPGQTGTYDATRQLPAATDQLRARLAWRWSLQ